MNHHEPTYDDPHPAAEDHRRRPPPANRVHEPRPDWPQFHAGPRWRIPTDPPPA